METAIMYHGEYLHACYTYLASKIEWKVEVFFMEGHYWCKLEAEPEKDGNR